MLYCCLWVLVSMVTCVFQDIAVEAAFPQSGITQMDDIYVEMNECVLWYRMVWWQLRCDIRQQQMVKHIQCCAEDEGQCRTHTGLHSLRSSITGRQIWHCLDPGMQWPPSRSAQGVPNPPARTMAACITDQVYLATADVVGSSRS